MMEKHDTYECKGLCNDCRYHKLEACDLHFPIKTIEIKGEKITRSVGSYTPKDNQEEIAILQVEGIPIKKRV